MQWKLVFFEDDAFHTPPVTHILPGRQLESYLDLDFLDKEFCQGHREMAEVMRADLSRVGARYHEYIGGTLVLVGIS